MPDIDMSPRPMAETSSGPHLRFSIDRLSEQIEILALLPLADLEVEAGDLGFLDLAEIIDKRFSQAFPHDFVFAQGLESVGEGSGKHDRFSFVRRIGRWRQCQLAPQAVETGVNLRGEIEIGIRRRLADAVLDPRAGIAGS